MKSFREYTLDNLTEVRVDISDYEASHEVSKFDGGYRPMVKHKKTGKASYLSQHSYQNKDHAVDAAKLYMSHMKHGTHGMRVCDKAMSDHAKAHPLQPKKA